MFAGSDRGDPCRERRCDAHPPPARDSPTKTLAKQALGPAVFRDPQSPGPGLCSERTEYEMGHGHHPCPNRGGLVVSVRGGGSVLRHRGRLIGESAPGTTAAGPGRDHGPVAARGAHVGESCIQIGAVKFTSDECQCFLEGCLICSMSSTSSCADHEPVESFLGPLKRDGVNQCQYRTRSEVRADIFNYIEHFYNP